MELIPVEGNIGLYRDSKSGAILNCSNNELSAYLKTKEIKLKEIEKFNNLDDKVNQLQNLQSDVDELKHMMRLILSKLESSS